VLNSSKSTFMDADELRVQSQFDGQALAQAVLDKLVLYGSRAAQRLAAR